MRIDFKRILPIFVFILLLKLSIQAAPDGKAIFQTNCASCHHPLKDATGPALKDADKKVPSKEWLYKWVKNSAAVVASGDKYANEIYTKWNKTAMTSFPSLTNEEIDAVVTYVNSVQPPSATPSSSTATAKSTSSDNTLLYAVLTILMLIVVIVLTSVNKILSRTADGIDGVKSPKDVPFYRNKVIIALTAIVAIVGFGVWLTKGSELGRQKNYMPKQPIFFSHKVHAGINQINCLYCHSGAEKSRHALIPSTNVCMNCHKQISEYSSAETHPLLTLEGKKVDGTNEIKKVYQYAGWDPIKKDYKKDVSGNILAKPVEWTKIHNLPDHVYFNHSLHTVSGKIACQKCHGNVEQMDEVFQFADLSMGWCVNCHRTSKVQFADNNYYSIYQKYHDEIKAGKREDVKVSDIGGLECQKCHY